jgi:exopolysaccharide biosynthesis polyprenyl glycosylphosphotransferase
MSILCDAVVVLYALLSSYWLRFCTPLRGVGVPADITLADYASYIAIGAFSLILALAGAKVYEPNALLRYRFVAVKALKASIFWATGFLGFALIFKFQPPISRLFVGICTITAPITLLAWRRLFHSFLLRSSAAADLQQRVVIVGWNDEAQHLADTFACDPTAAYRVVGCVAPAQGRFQKDPSVPMLGQVQDLQDLFHEHEIDIAILSDVDGLKGEIVGLANLCEKEMVQFKIVPSYFQILVSGLHLETVSGIPVLGVSQLPLDRQVNVLIKRTMDLAGAVVGLLLSVPLVAIFGFLVYRESPGPIFYRQRRLGRNGVPFNIIKIRSMRLDAEAGGRVGWSTKVDPRRLRVGAMMRKYNIDELPQFWNVLKGEMSLVGPRPERPELIADFKEDIPHYNARHNVKPGITGWAQVKGFRGDTDLTERIRCDLFYLENWNFFLDLQILAMTVTSNKNAA